MKKLLFALIAVAAFACGDGSKSGSGNEAGSDCISGYNSNRYSDAK
jgi:hypothetical protein